MPRVPQVTGPSVAESALPSVYESNAATPDLLSAPGRAEQALGDAATTTGSQLEVVRNQMVSQANALRVDDALNQATEVALRLQHDKTEGFVNQTGYAALNRASGMPLADEYTGKLQKSVSDIASTLGNDQQRQMFGAKVNNLVTNFYGQALTHESNQQRDYNLSVRDATVSNASNSLQLNFTDPENIKTQVTRIRSAIEGGQDENGVFIPGSAQMLGKSAAWAREKSDEAVSGAHAGAVKSALEQGNVNLAMAYFKKYSPDMTARDVLAVQGTLQRDYDTRLGMTVGNRAVDAVRDKQAPPTDYDRAKNIRIALESGGKGDFNPDGTLLQGPMTSSGERALGSRQVMPSTAANPGYGIKAADMSGTAQQQAAELARVGDQKWDVLVKMFNGDLPKVFAAYNAGEGTVRTAMNSAEADHGKFGDWTAYLPKETQGYVASAMDRYNAGDGVPPKPTLEEVHQTVRTALGPNASPTAVKTAIETATQRFNDAQATTKQRGEEAVTQAMQLLDRNGGKYAELPADARDALVRLAPDKVDDVFKYAARIAKGDDSTNPAVYLRLSDQNYLGKLTDVQLYALKGQLSQDDFKHFSTERARIVSGQASNGPGDLNTAAINSTLNLRLSELKIDPTPKSDGGNDAARVGTIKQYVNSQIALMQRDAGKKFNDVETAAAVDKLVSQDAKLKGWLGTYSAPAISAKVGDIPSTTVDSIKAAFKKQGVDDPTDAQVLGAFLHLNARRK